MNPLSDAEAARFFALVDGGAFDDEHWMWKGPLSGKSETPTFWGNRGTRSAARLAWEMVFGAVPREKLVARQCDQKGCINPHHRLLRTPKGVGRRYALLHGKERCPKGHDLTVKGARIKRTSGDHWRGMCRQCNAERHVQIRSDARKWRDYVKSLKESA